MCEVNIYEAKTNLSKYIEMLETGVENEIIICRYGKEIAKITLFNEKKAKPRTGGGIGILPDEPYVLDSEEYGIEEMFYGKEYLWNCY